MVVQLRWWFNYDEGHLGVLSDLLSEDCHLIAGTELGNHPYEEFIRSHSRYRFGAMAWDRGTPQAQPVPLTPPRDQHSRRRPTR